MEITIEKRIGRPVSTVAAYAIDPANEPRWILGIVSSEPLTPGPIAIGSRVRRVAKFMGRTIDYTPQVLEFEPDRRLLMRTESPFPMTIEYEFSGDGDGTVFRQRLAGGPGGVMRLFSPLMAKMVARNVAADMERLRALLEAAGTRPTQ